MLDPRNAGMVQPLFLLKQSQHSSGKNGLSCMFPDCDPLFKYV